MKRAFLLMVVPALLVALGFAQTPTTSGNPEQTNIKGCLGGSDGNYTVVEDNTGHIFKITTSSVDLKAHLGHDVTLIGHKASEASAAAADNKFAVTELNMIAEHCLAAAPAVPAATVSMHSETAAPPPAAATAPAATASTLPETAVTPAAPAATVITPAETTVTPSAVPAAPAATVITPAETTVTPAAAPAATVTTPAETTVTPSAVPAAPAATVITPAETTVTPAVAVAAHPTRLPAHPRSVPAKPAAAPTKPAVAATSETASTPAAAAGPLDTTASPSPETASTPAAAPTPTAPAKRGSLWLLIAFAVVVIVLGILAPSISRWRKRRALEQTGAPNLSFTREASSDKNKIDPPAPRKVA